MSARPIAIACGDPAGIGPEVTLRAVAQERQQGSPSHFVLFGDQAQLRALDHRLGTRLELRPTSLSELANPAASGSGRILLVDPRSQPLIAPWPPGSAPCALAGLEYLRAAAEACHGGSCSALVTAPVSKEAILRAGISFVGQTEFLAQLTGTSEVTMMLLGDDERGRWLRVALVTTHLPLREVADAIRTEEVERAIRQSHEACRALRLPRARVAVCGLNPHAGEGGMLGTEEIEIIAPAIRAARDAGLDVHGPVAADTLFHQAIRGDYDVVVAMYHDQGLPPLKLAAFERGVNWTLGLPFPRTSPDHGTAFDLVGKDAADPSSMHAAIRLAASLSQRK